MPTVDELLGRAERKIRASRAVDLWRVSDARINAEELLSEVLRRTIRSRDLDKEVSSSQERRFWNMVQRRTSGEPVALIIGKTEFRGMELRVRRGAFVPRNSSEHLAGQAIRRLKPRGKPTAVDVATGTGPVALAIAREVPGSRVFGLDISARQLRLARQNAAALAIPNTRFLKSDMLQALPNSLRGEVDVFTLHPPYVTNSELPTLPKEILAFEPHEALTDRSGDGLGLVRRLADEAPRWLRPGGWVLIEVSPNLSRQVMAILRRGGFAGIRSLKDSLGVTRVICGSLPKLTR